MATISLFQKAFSFVVMALIDPSGEEEVVSDFVLSARARRIQLLLLRSVGR